MERRPPQNLNNETMANCNCSNSAHAVAILAAGSTNSPYYFMANITKRLCRACCTANVPVFAPAFSVIGWESVGATQYVASVRVQGCITYNPCETCCCAVTEPVSQVMTIPFKSASAPSSVTIAAGATTNAISVPGCQPCGRTFVSETPLTLTIA